VTVPTGVAVRAIDPLFVAQCDRRIDRMVACSSHQLETKQLAEELLETVRSERTSRGQPIRFWRRPRRVLRP
jgi:hypothetical protein